MLQEFKEFALKGNVLDLAVGIVVGLAFGAIITSLVNDLIMPPIGLIVGGLDFKDLFLVLDGNSYGSLEEARSAGAPVLAYGSFVNTIVNFLIVSFSIFLVVKQVNRARRPAAAPPPPATKECAFCISQVPAKAIRCPHCTSDLKGAAVSGS